jgi:adenylate cyclase
MSGDPEQEYFSDGITEDLITDLAKISGLFVIARNSSFVYKGRPVKVEQVSRELGVRYVVEGSVRKVAERVRITAQLVDATTGHHLWAERYDRRLEDIFALQDDVTSKIVDALEVELTGEEQPGVKRPPTENLEAYDYLLRGSTYLRRVTAEANRQAREMFEKAIELDPKYADAYSRLAFTHFFAWWFQWSDDPEMLQRAFELAHRALALDDSIGLPYSVLAWQHALNGHHDEATAEAEKAVTLEPNRAALHLHLGGMLIYAGRAEEAIGVLKDGMRLDPHLTFFFDTALADSYRLRGRYDEAIGHAKQALRFNPDLLLAHWVLAVIYADLGQEEQARREAAEILRMSPEYSLEALRQRLPYRDPAIMDHAIAALRKAGLK